jgi:hypothetical protein
MVTRLAEGGVWLVFFDALQESKNARKRVPRVAWNESQKCKARAKADPYGMKPEMQKQMQRQM